MKERIETLDWMLKRTRDWKKEMLEVAEWNNHREMMFKHHVAVLETMIEELIMEGEKQHENDK